LRLTSDITKQITKTLGPKTNEFAIVEINDPTRYRNPLVTPLPQRKIVLKLEKIRRKSTNNGVVSDLRGLFRIFLVQACRAE